MIFLLLVIGVAGTVFFLTRWMQLRSGYNSMSEVERRYAEVSASIAEKREAEAEDTWDSRRRRLYAYVGMKDSLVPLLFAGGFAILAVTAVLIALGIEAYIAVLLSIPTVAVILLISVRVSAGRRARRFNVQMITLLDLLTAQLRSGVGTERALVAIMPSLQEPMHGEISRALAAASAGGDLIANLSQMRDRYPSRALDMFLSALEIDRSEGHSIVPALEQASTIMKNAFTLQSEGRAELASAKWEFYGVLAVILGLTAQLVLSNPNARATWLSPLGAAILLAALANTGWGIWRFLKITKSLEKETE